MNKWKSIPENRTGPSIFEYRLSKLINKRKKLTFESFKEHILEADIKKK